MPEEAVRSAGDERRAGDDDHPEGPETTQRQDRPPLQDLRQCEDDPAGDRERRRRRVTHRRFGEHRRECPRIRQLHPAIHIVRRLDPAEGALCALVARGAERFDGHEGKDNDRGSNLRPQPNLRPPLSWYVASAFRRTSPAAYGKVRLKPDSTYRSRYCYLRAAVAGVNHQTLERAWREAAAERRQIHGPRARDQRAGRAVEAPFAGERAPARGGLTRVDPGPAVRERVECRVRRELAA